LLLPAGTTYRDDPARIVSNCVSAGEQTTLHQTKGIYPMLAVIPPFIDNFTDEV